MNDPLKIALHFLKFRPRSIFEIEQKLKTKGVPDKETKRVIEILKKNKLLDAAKNIDWIVEKPAIFFKCEYGVFSKNDNGSLGSICYCTSKERAKFIADALNELNKHRKK